MLEHPSTSLILVTAVLILREYVMVSVVVGIVQGFTI